MSKGCNDCANNKIGTITKAAHCKLGIYGYAKWWEDNGKKMPTDELDEMLCFEDTDINARLDNAINLVDKMIAIVDRQNAEKLSQNS